MKGIMRPSSSNTPNRCRECGTPLSQYIALKMKTLKNHQLAILFIAVVGAANPAWSQLSITQQPAHQPVSLGANVTFQVGATGSAPLAYQWRRNGNDVSGATNSSLALLNVQD